MPNNRSIPLGDWWVVITTALAAAPDAGERYHLCAQLTVLSRWAAGWGYEALEMLASQYFDPEMERLILAYAEAAEDERWLAFEWPAVLTVTAQAPAGREQG